MAHPLELSIAQAIKNERELQKALDVLNGDLKSALERESILKGRIEVLDQQILDLKSKADHWMTCTIEIARQMHNVGIFVTDAMNLARNAVGKGNSGNMQAALDAVEQALIAPMKEVDHEPVQRKEQR